MAGVTPTITFAGQALGSVANACAQGTDANGDCTVVATSATAGTSTMTAAADVPVAGATVHRTATASLTAVDASLALTASTTTGAVGQPVTLTGSASINLGAGFVSAPDGTLITFSLTGGPGSLSAQTCTTANNTGTCSVTLSASSAGISAVSASATVTAGGTPLSLSAHLDVTWVDAQIQVGVSGANPVNQARTITGTVYSNPGLGFVPAPDGTVITFSIVSGPGVLTPLSCTTTGGTGSCSVTLTSSEPGTTVVGATTDVMVGSVQLTRSAAGAELATIAWVDAQIGLNPLSATNFVGAPQALSATVQQTTGPGWTAAPDGTLVTFSLLNNSAGAAFVGGGDTCATSGGSCSVGILGSAAGTVTVHAVTSLSVGGADLTRATASGGNNSADAIFTFVTPTGQLAPTQTTCGSYAAGTAAALTDLAYNVKGKTINSVSPGVFFYFSRVNAPAASFTLQIVQANSNPAVPLFNVQQGNQITLYNADCSTSSLGTVSSAGGQATVNVTGAAAGQSFILLVKYDTSSVVGAPVPDPTTVHYDYATKANDVLVDRSAQGLNLNKK
jgi:hypothetical protein